MKIVLFDRQIEIMQVLWDRGSATVAEVRDALGGELAYTTVLTIMRRLEEKGYISRAQEGRAHRYMPTIGPEDARESALKRLTRGLFNGSAELLISELVSGENLSRDQLRRIRDLVEDQLPEEDK
jgi:BlaI family transcriptional regulator, penicillinase repressor